MTKLVLLYGIEIDNETAKNFKDIKLYETTDGQFYFGDILSKGEDKKSLRIPIGEDYTEDYYDDKFYSYLENIQLKIKDDNVSAILEDISNEDTPDLYVLNIK